MRGRRSKTLVAVGALGILAVPGLAAAAGALNLVPDFALLGVHLLVLLALIYPTQRLLLAPLVGVLEERERRTQGASSEGEALLGRAAELEGSLEERIRSARAAAQARRAQIIAGAEAEEQELLAAARSDGAEKLERVRGEIASELEAARQVLREDARSLARDAAAKILGRAL